MIDSLQEQDREELVKFLKEGSILRMIDDDRIIYGLSLSLEEMNCGPGHVVFREGDPGDGLYIIKQGSVEVRRTDIATPIAYLTAGECFGEMSLLHGSPRTATIRVPEAAVILKLSKSASTDLQAKFPRLAQELNRVAQKRDTGRSAFLAPGLQGNTAFFDLPTVIQAVATSRQSGTLNIFATPSKPSATLLFYTGHLVSAEFKHLVGEEAVFELLSSPDSADFAFARCNDGEIDESRRQTTIRAIERLLIEGSRRVDELAKIFNVVGGPTMTFSTNKELKTQELSEGSRELAPRVWKLIELDLTVEEMFPLINTDRYTILHILSEMLSKKLITQIAKLLVDGDPAAGLSAAANRASTAEVNLRQLVKQSTKLATTLYALNMVASNLSNIITADIVQTCLDEALHESVKKYPQMNCLKVHRGGNALDVRGATPEFSARSDSTVALNFFTRRFLQLVGAMVYESPTPSVKN
jgi:hypothetical protein